jgi:hypothetical protein
MRAAEIIPVPPISGAANAATAITNAATAFPGTFRQFVPPAGKKCSRHDSGHAPDILQRAGRNTEAIP